MKRKRAKLKMLSKKDADEEINIVFMLNRRTINSIFKILNV